MIKNEKDFLLAIFDEEDHQKIIEIINKYDSNEWIERFLEDD